MSRCDNEGATHHTGCECHEARRDAEVARLRSALRLLLEEAQDKCVIRDTTFDAVAAALKENP